MSQLRQSTVGGWTATWWRPRQPLLSAVVEVWSVRGPQLCRAVQLPPYPGVQLVFNLGDPYVVDGQLRREAWIEGIWEGAMTTAATGATHLMGVRFQPWGAARVLGPIAGECAHRVVDAESAVGRSVRVLRQRLLQPATEAARCRMVDEYLCRKLRDPRPDVEEGLRLLSRSGGGAPIDTIARRAGLEIRTFRRQCERIIGVSPKRLARLLRFDRSIGALARRDSVVWADFAVAQGYYDQSHLIREWRSLFGMSPQEFVRTRAAFGQYVVPVTPDR